MKNLNVGIITVSDRCSSGESEDKSGEVLRKLATKYLNASVTSALVPDEPHQIESELLHMADELCVQLILTTGGTGFSPRDVTPEATRKVIHKEAPQMSLAMSLVSFQKTKFAALSRAVCGIRNNTLICNMPGSPKAVDECFMAIVDVLPHAIDLINGNQGNVQKSHEIESHSSNNAIQNNNHAANHKHVCPHKTGSGTADDRNSPFPMIAVDVALKTILDAIQNTHFSHSHFKSPINIPEFRASIKDGYAVKANGSCKGIKHVIGYIGAGDDIIRDDFDSNSCYKINTGAAVPDFANAIVQIEDTKLIKSDDGIEKEVEILVEPTEGLDIRSIGSDLAKGDVLFRGTTDFPDIVQFKSLLASVGVAIDSTHISEVPICILSTGDELTAPGHPLKSGKIYDSNTTMLRALLEQHGFTKISTVTSSDTFASMNDAIRAQAEKNTFIICSGSVSMGDKDFLKPVLLELGFDIHFGRVNMKPGKPMTFADRKTSGKNCYLFGLPGNPVSAFATFNLFVLPALRKYAGYSKHKWSLPVIDVEVLNEKIELDPRPEYARARILSRQGKFFAEITDNQMSSRLTSISDADVLLHLPQRVKTREFVEKGAQLKASILRHHFISEYLD